jgi:hypothetical protein
MKHESMNHVWRPIERDFHVSKFECIKCGMTKIIRSPGDAHPYTRYRGATGVEIERAGVCNGKA